MKGKLFLALFVCLSVFFMHNHVFAEEQEKKAADDKKATPQASWVRRGDIPRQPEDGEYTVREGDTLWDISNSFLKDPFKWQNLWKENPSIINPHLIYPGNKIRLFPPAPVEAGEKGKEAGVEAAPAVPEGLPVEKLQKPEETSPVMPKAEEEKPKEEKAEAQPPQPPVAEKPAPLPEIVKISSTMMERHGLISAQDKEGIGVIVGSREEKLLLSQGDIVYISLAKGTEVKAGDKFTIFTIANEVKHPVTKEPIGFLTDTLGILEVTSVEPDGVIAATIERSYKEIIKGARLKPYEPPVREVVVKKAEKGVDGLIIESLEGKEGSAENDIVYLDKGKNNGLDVGNVMDIFRPTTMIADPMSKEKKAITFPPTELGRLVIISVEDNTSAAFITKSKQAIYKGDRVKTAE
ncbi:MAG: LysM peptidoglycan-binding domain-containing protein [Deltaproteobacteria bacterium]|nr:LysM peptidoglycan-binding domain-containing protein [Deltaproteobacteria bacterium]